MSTEETLQSLTEVPVENEGNENQKVTEELEKIFEDSKTSTETTENLDEQKDILLDELEKVIEEKAKEIEETVAKEAPKNQTIEDQLKEIVGDDSFDQNDDETTTKVDLGDTNPFFDQKSLNLELQTTETDQNASNLEQKITNEPQLTQIEPELTQIQSELAQVEPKLTQIGSDSEQITPLIEIVPDLVGNDTNLAQPESSKIPTLAEKAPDLVTNIPNMAQNGIETSQIKIDQPPESNLIQNAPEVAKIQIQSQIVKVDADLAKKNSDFMKELDLKHTGGASKIGTEPQKVIPVIRKVVPAYQIDISGNLVRVSVTGDSNKNNEKSAEEKENLGKTLGESRRVIEKRSVVLERRFKEEEESLVEMQVPEVETPKRKRGRPRKSQVDPDPPFSPFGNSAKKKNNVVKRPAPPSPENVNSEPKKKRGRPRKNLGFGFHNIVAEAKNIKLPSSKWSVHINPGSETRQVCFTKSELKNGDSSTPVVDRLVKFMGGKNFYVKINNKLVELIGSPKTVESLADVEILLTIVNDIQSNDSLIKSYIR